MVCGAPPFTGNVGELLAAHMFTEPVPARTHAPISRALDALIARLLAKEPADRPRDASAVIGALDGPTSATLLVEAPPAGEPVRVARGFDDAPPVMLAPKRSAMPIIAAVATLAIAATTLGLVFGHGGGGDTAPPAAAPPAKVIAADPAPAPIPATPTPAPSPAPAPPGPMPDVVVKKKPVARRVEHAAERPVERPVDQASGPVTMPEVSAEPPVAKPTGPLVTPQGAPLSAAP